MDINATDPTSLDVAHQVQNLSFQFFTEEEALNLSVRRITSPHAFDDLGRPIPRGLYDPLLGPTSNSDGPCHTCGLFYQSCPGHFGHIELPFPLPNPLLSKVILKLLRASCPSCLTFLLPKEDVSLILSRLYFEDAGLPRPANAVESYRALRRNSASRATSASGTKSKNSAAEQPTEATSDAPASAVVKNWANFFASMPAPLSTYLQDVDPKNSSQVERNILRAARITWKRAKKHGRLRASRSKGWREAEALLLATSKNVCTQCHRRPFTLRSGSRGTLFRKIMGSSTETLLSPIEVERQIAGVCSNHTEIFSLLFGLKGRLSDEDNVSHVTENLHRRLFVRLILVPPSRFRPASDVETMEIASEHPQNIFFQRMLTEIDVILKANELGLEGDDAVHDDDDEDEDANRPVKERPTKSRFAQAMVNLQEALNDLYDSSQSSQSQGATQATGIRQQFEAKAGLFRQHMMGKRVNYSCRSVIGPDVFLDTDEIGIPESFAKKLSIPEAVTPTNLEQMQQAVLNGAKKYPGALAVEDQTSTGELRMIKFTEKTSQQILQSQASLLLQNRVPRRHPQKSKRAIVDNDSINMTPKRVHRHLKTGDVVLFNRQPTLHRVSIMALRVRVLPGDRTIRFHYANCGSFNADFDGDEMNVHVPQDYVSRAEAEELMLSSQHYVVPTSGAPIRGLIQDHIAAATLLSRKGTFLDRGTFMQLLFSATENIMQRPSRSSQGYVLPEPAVYKPVPLWTGKQLISAVLFVVRDGRPGLHMEGGTKVKPNIVGKEETQVIVRDGELLQGIIDKSSIGASMYGLVHAIQEAYGCQASDDFLSCMGRLCLYYMRMHGHTTGVGDLTLQDEGDKRRYDILRKGIDNLGIEMANAVSSELSNKAEDEDPAATTGEEARVLIEEMVRKDGKEAEDRLDSAMKTALNKVSSDVMQACVPRNLKKPFPMNGFALMTNTGAKGSAVNAAQISCLLGSTVLEGKRVPRMGGSGATLPCFEPYDSSPLAGGFIASRFLTGITPPEFFFHAMSGREGLLDTSLKTANSGYLQRCLIKHLEGVQLRYDGSARDSDGSILQFIYGDDGIDPCKARWLTNKSIDKLKWQLKNRRCLSVPHEPVHPEVVAARDQIAAEAVEGQSGNTLLELTSPCALAKRGAVSEQFEALIKTAREDPNSNERDREFLEGRYQAATAEPGECVGVLAAQGVGEPSTQMTLNTFHHAGSSSAHVTLGIPRLRELLMTASPYPKTPSMTLHIASQNSKRGAETMRRRLQNVSVLDLLLNIELRDINIFFSSSTTNCAAKRMAIGLYFPEEELYSTSLGYSFEHIANFVSTSFVAELAQILSSEAKKLSGLGDAVVSSVAKDYINCAVVPKHLNGGSGAVHAKGYGQKLEDDRNDEDTEQIGDYEDAEASSSGEEDDDDKTGDENSEGEAELSNYAEDENGASTDENKKRDRGRKEKKKKKKKKEDTKLHVKNTMDVEEDELNDRLHYGSMGFVPDSVTSIEKRIVEFEWIVPVFFSGSIDIARAVREAAERAKLSQVERITKCFVNEEDGKYSVITEGSNLQAIFKNGGDLIDYNKLETNDMYGILQTYGVEAMRAALIKEFVKIFDAYGIPVDIRHLQLIADHMTIHGDYRGFNRMCMQDTPSAMQQITFETSMKFLTEAALSGRKENLSSPSAALAVGQLCETGTGGFQLHQRVQ